MDTIHVTLPDGSVKDVPKGTTPYDVARGISPRLADAAFAAKAYSNNGALSGFGDPVEDGGPGRFGLPHHVTDRPLEQLAVHRAVESDKHAKLPLRAGVARFLREPNVQLSPRQRESPVIKFHPDYLSNPCPAANLSRRVLGRISVQFCSM